ncbi:putative RNA methyltransferase [Spirochaetia bacterium]|nr:putative RNA methyltransferase [Spirochaetia bacterium]
MAMGEIFTAPVEAIVSGGAGLARFEGRPVFIGLTAPGDMVRARIVREHSGWAEGEPAEIITPSPKRISPACPLFGICGGCSLQHLAYEDQLEAKAAILKDAFTRIGGLKTLPEPQIHPGPPWEYRNRVQFHRIIKGKYRIGFKSRKSEELVPIPDCPIVDPGIRELLCAGDIIPPPDRDRFTLYSRGGLVLQEGRQIRGKVTISGRELTMDAGVFFQSNALMQEALIKDLIKIAAQADNTRPMADIYCGVGAFAFFLQEMFKRIDLIEENKTALALARENVRGNENGYFALTDDQWVKGPGQKAANHGFIVADPPRQGLSPAMRKWLSSLVAQKDTSGGVPSLAYVSCDPATLARDSRELMAGGYELAELHLYDFYPQTAHIESLALFREKGADV